MFHKFGYLTGLEKILVNEHYVLLRENELLKFPI